MKFRTSVGFLLQCTLTGFAIAGLYLLLQPDRDAGTGSIASTPPGDAQGFGYSYADAVSASSPSVVTIYTSKQVQRAGHSLLEDPDLAPLFAGQPKLREPTRTETSLGSGVIMSADGYIITNQHVIKGAEEILVSLPDGRGSKADLIGQDRETDIAILRIPMQDLNAIKIANPRLLRVGDVVLAIGNPLNVGQTVTLGIISAMGRNRVGLNTFENFIQTDAAINPGNSGGALVNAQGELIGINTAIFGPNGRAQGIGLAIPTSIALDIMQQIVQQGRVSRGWLGVEGIEVTANAAASTGNPAITGALIIDVFVDSPADKAGIQAGDILVTVDGSRVRGVRDLLEKIALQRPGEVIEVGIYRGPRQLFFPLQVIERPQ